MASVTVRAPSSTANLGPGFDVFGLAMDAFYDKVTLAETGKEITIVTDDDIPADPDRNTAGLVVRNMAERFGVGGGVEIRISKGCRQGLEWEAARHPRQRQPWRLTDCLD